MKPRSFRIAIFLAIFSFFSYQFVISGSIFSLKETVNQIASRLETGEDPDTIFSFPISSTPDQEVRVVWLDPKKWLSNADPKKLNSYIGLLTFVRLNAPFHRVQQALTAYQDAPKFTPGLIGTKVLEWKRLSPEKSIVEINRKRKMPPLLAGLKDADYRIQNQVNVKDQNFVLVRSSLDLEEGKVGARDVMQEMEGFEFIRKINEEKTLYVAGMFTLPNTGIIPARAPADHSGKSETKKNVFNAMKSKLEALDVRTRFFEVISKSVLEDAYQATAGLMQATTDSRWRNKWAHQLTPADSKQLFKESERLLKTAKKNGWITFPS